MARSVALILAKTNSDRLPGKNTLDFNGEPMFVVNVKKCKKYFTDVYVSSDDEKILKMARKVGARTIKRGEELCGDTPNIPVYRHAWVNMDCPETIVAVQANSPTVDEKLIALAADIIQSGTVDEVMTCHEDHSIYGSIWALTSRKLFLYEDFYNSKPDVLIVDNSIDIHTKDDYEKCLLTQAL